MSLYQPVSTTCEDKLSSETCCCAYPLVMCCDFEIGHAVLTEYFGNARLAGCLRRRELISQSGALLCALPCSCAWNMSFQCCLICLARAITTSSRAPCSWCLHYLKRSSQGQGMSPTYRQSRLTVPSWFGLQRTVESDGTFPSCCA